MAAWRGGRLVEAKEWLRDVAQLVKRVHRRLRGVARWARDIAQPICEAGSGRGGGR